MLQTARQTADDIFGGGTTIHCMAGSRELVSAPYGNSLLMIASRQHGSGAAPSLWTELDPRISS